MFAAFSRCDLRPLFLTTEALVAEKPEKEKMPMPGGGGMGGDMDF